MIESKGLLKLKCRNIRGYIKEVLYSVGLKCKVFIQPTCKDCFNKWTDMCPIRVWGRCEKQFGMFNDVDINKDYCSRFKRKVDNV